MTDYRLVAAVLCLEAFWIVFGSACGVVAVKKGFIDRRIERRGKVLTGQTAVLAGLIYLFIAALGWAAAVLTAWSWFKGRLHW